MFFFVGCTTSPKKEWEIGQVEMSVFALPKRYFNIDVHSDVLCLIETYRIWTNYYRMINHNHAIGKAVYFYGLPQCQLWIPTNTVRSRQSNPKEQVPGVLYLNQYYRIITNIDIASFLLPSYFLKTQNWIFWWKELWN